MTEYKIGDNILITKGYYEGVPGIIEGIDGRILSIHLDDDVLISTHKRNILSNCLNYHYYYDDEIMIDKIKQRNDTIEKILA